MSYTLWSRGRLLGETDFEFVRCFDKMRMGFLHPTDAGYQIMPIACGVSPAFRKLADATGLSKRRRSVDQADGMSQEAMMATTEYADLAAAIAHQEGLDLELRSPGGNTIRTEYIAIIDTEYLIGIAKKLEESDEGEQYDFGEPEDEEMKAELAAFEAEMEADLEEMMAEMEADWAWRPDDDEECTLPRYQIQVELIDEWDVP